MWKDGIHTCALGAGAFLTLGLDKAILEARPRSYGFELSTGNCH